jgi:hypothetical protein
MEVNWIRTKPGGDKQEEMRYLGGATNRARRFLQRGDLALTSPFSFGKGNLSKKPLARKNLLDGFSNDSNGFNLWIEDSW